tara:strand:- start:124 stop:573 length:450 start_codon:yes stop_codon:yes gene_type:complete
MKFSYLAFFLFIFSFAIPENKAVKNNSDNIKKDSYIDNMKAENFKAKMALNKLKEDFYDEKQNINQNYERKIKNLKSSKKNDLKNLKDRYRNKMKRLRRQYPEIPDMNIDSKPKPKPVHPSSNFNKDDNIDKIKRDKKIKKIKNKDKSK